MTKTTYLVERVPWVQAAGPGTATFESDLDDQLRPILGFHLTGDCPSCGHRTSGICPVSAVALKFANPVGVLTSSTGATVAMTVMAASPAGGLIAWPIGAIRLLLSTRTTVCVVTCQCSETHAQAPPAPGITTADPASPAVPRYGCGSSWLVQAKYRIVGKNRTKAVEPVPATEQFKYWRAADANAAAAPASLTTVQSIASKWQTAITAVLGLVGVATLVGGRETLQKLDPLAQKYVGGAALVAILFSAGASFSFAKSSSGIPTLKPFNSPSDLFNADLLPLRQAWRSARDLRVAFALATLSLCAAIVAVGFVLYGNPAKPPTDVKVAVLDSGKTYELCGAATVNADDGTITVTPGPGDAKTATYKLSHVTAIGRC